MVMFAALIASADAQPPTSLDVAVSSGAFRFHDIRFSSTAPFFSAQARNETGRRWTDITFEISLHDSSGSRDSLSLSAPHPEGVQIFRDENIHLASTENFLSQGYHVDPLRIDSMSVVVHGVYIDTRPAPTYSGLVFAEDCMADAVKMLSVSGLAQRKMLSEMLASGCAADYEEPRLVDLFAGEKPRFAHSRKLVRAFLNELAGETEIPRGWILADRIQQRPCNFEVAYPGTADAPGRFIGAEPYP
jgi:hypothetical protein